MSARERRLNTPPTWRSSITRALIAAVVVFAFLVLTAKGKNRFGTAIAFTVVALAIYIPAGYYLELTLYRRRQRRLAGSGGQGGTRRSRNR